MSWSFLRDPAEDDRKAPPYDPYAAFAALTRHAYVQRQKEGFHYVILELKKGWSAKRFAQTDWAAAKKSSGASAADVRVPSLYQHVARGLDETRFCTALVRLDTGATASANAGDRPDSLTLRLPEVLEPVVERWQACLSVIGDVYCEMCDGPAKAPARKPQAAGESSAIVGIIDDGLAFAHRRLRRSATQTRIASFWNQDDVDHRAPYPGYGRTLSAAEIDGLVKAATSGGLIDEDAVYREARNSRLQQRAAHGTHVMDIACGEKLDAKKKAPLDASTVVCVQLPSRVTVDTSGSSLAGFVLDGLHYILQCADQIGGDRRVVVNLSYGMIAGPHDGTGLLEAAIDELVTLRRAATSLEVVLPAGNSRLARCHAHFDLDHAKAQSLTWRVQPDDWTPSFMEIWIPKASGAARAADIAITVTPPRGVQSPTMKRGTVGVWRPRDEVTCAVMFPAQSGFGHLDRVLVALAPTFTLETQRDVAPAGNWRIVVENGGARTTVDAWIQRDDAALGFPRRGRQSRFDDRNHLYRDPITGRPVATDEEESNLKSAGHAAAASSYVKRANTINAIATGATTIKAEGFSGGDPTRPRALYSGLGPDGATAVTTGGAQRVSGAISDYSASSGGVLGAGTRSGSVFAMTGTSVAAPQVTRFVARPPPKAAATRLPGLPPIVEDPGPVKLPR